MQSCTVNFIWQCNQLKTLCEIYQRHILLEITQSLNEQRITSKLFDYNWQHVQNSQTYMVVHCDVWTAALEVSSAWFNNDFINELTIQRSVITNTARDTDSIDDETTLCHNKHSTRHWQHQWLTTMRDFNFCWAVLLSGNKPLHFFKWSWNYRSANCLVLWKW